MKWIRIGTERVDVRRGRWVRAACREVDELPPEPEDLDADPEVDLEHFWLDGVEEAA